MTATKKMWLKRLTSVKANVIEIWKKQNIPKSKLTQITLTLEFLALMFMMVFVLTFVGIIIGNGFLSYYTPIIGYPVFILLAVIYIVKHAAGWITMMTALIIFLLMVGMVGGFQLAVTPLPKKYLEESVKDKCYATVLSRKINSKRNVNLYEHISSKYDCVRYEGGIPPVEKTQLEIIQSANIMHGLGQR